MGRRRGLIVASATRIAQGGGGGSVSLQIGGLARRGGADRNQTFAVNATGTLEQMTPGVGGYER